MVYENAEAFNRIRYGPDVRYRSWARLVFSLTVGIVALLVASPRVGWGYAALYAVLIAALLYFLSRLPLEMLDRGTRGDDAEF